MNPSLTVACGLHSVHSLSSKKKRMGYSGLLAFLLGASVFFPAFAETKTSAQADKDPADWVESEAGIPVTDPLTKEKCGTCHSSDSKGNLSRISWTRTTPEGWAQTLKRMVKLNGLSISPDEARSIVQYLSTSHGLAPEEAKPVMYFAERRIQDETIIPNETLHQTCASCHAFAQPMSSRRSHREWALVQNLHKALYATAQRTYDQPAHPPVGQGGADNSSVKKTVTHGQVALDWLTKNAALHTPEWAVWSPSMRTPLLAGKWLITATYDGRGRFFGEMTITPQGAGTFATDVTLRPLEGGQPFSRKGKGLVYAGYSWRGTLEGTATPTHPESLAAPMRETMWFSPDQTMAKGRWYWGEYHEFGLDVSLVRETGAPILVATGPVALKTGMQQAELHLYGAGLPTSLSPRDIDLGNGVTVEKIASVSPQEFIATVDVAPNATPGPRTASLQGATLQNAFTVYSSIDYLKVTPQTALAHLGGIKYGKGYQQFASEGWSVGPDGKQGTSDDFLISPVVSNWSLQEFPTVTYDNDTDFVGKLDPTSGLFTPNVEGPNPRRRFMRNNYGEVWVVATAKEEKGKDGTPLVGRSYLVTTVPAYKRWDQPEVSE